MFKVKKLIDKEIYLNIFVYIIYISLSYFYFTPPNNLIFWDIDSRLQIEEFIQILNPSSLWDFIFDSAYGNLTVYGRIFQFITAIIMLLIGTFTNFSYPVLAFITQSILMFTGLSIITKKLIENIYLRFFLLINLLLVCVESKVLIKTTGLEVLTFSIATILIYSKKNSLAYFFFGILSGIKFINIIYPFVFLLLTIKKENISGFGKNLIYGLAGLVIAQPFIVTSKGFKSFLNIVIWHLNYKEGYLVRPSDWLTLIRNEFNLIFLLPLILYFLFKVPSITFSKLETFLLIAPIFQISSYLFSENLIRSHYLNLPICILIIVITKKVPLKIFSKCLILTIFLIANLNYFINSSKNIANIDNFSSYSNVMEALYKQDKYIAMNEINNFILNDLMSKEDNLIWWQVDGNIRPYSVFHWGSTENPLTVDYYYKDIWGDAKKFPHDRCADYGGIAVLVLNTEDSLKVIDDFKNKNFTLVKTLEILNKSQSFGQLENYKNVLANPVDNSVKSYYVFYNSKNQPPYGC